MDGALSCYAGGGHSVPHLAILPVISVRLAFAGRYYPILEVFMRSLRFNSKTAVSIVHEGHRPGQGRWARTEYHRAIRRLTPRLIAEQLAEMEAAEPGITIGNDLDEDPLLRWLPRDAKPKNLLAEISAIMKRAGVSSDDVKFVNHSTGCMNWAEFASVAGKAIFYQGSYSIFGLDDNLAIVGSDWWIEPVFEEFGAYLHFVRMPTPVPYYQTPSADLFGEHTLLHRAA
jgi:hypothetical protein